MNYRAYQSRLALHYHHLLQLVYLLIVDFKWSLPTHPTQTGYVHIHTDVFRKNHVHGCLDIWASCKIITYASTFPHSLMSDLLGNTFLTVLVMYIYPLGSSCA
jgi:hypothetical protein